MKRVIAFFLSWYLFMGSLLPGDSIFELSFLPSLIQHYQLHKQTETQGISFVDFLKLHYLNKKHEQSDPVNHSNLPMHHHSNIAAMDELVNKGMSHSAIGLVNYSNKVYFQFHFYSPDNQFSSGVFHPPSVS